MIELGKNIQRLLVEAMIAAPNYGLHGPAEALLGVLPLLGCNDEVKALSTALVKFCLFQPRAALDALKDQSNSHAQALRQVVTQYIEDAVRQKRTMI